jgi:hypothetical protein
MSGKTAPQAVVVFDVNVLINAANPTSGSHETAIRALSDDNGMPIYFSEMMLKTTANKLLEMGADPEVVHEYLELIMSDDDYGPEKHVLGFIPVTDYGLVDRYGKSDYEDSTIVSLMDAAEDEARLPAVLVSSDGALRTWCEDNGRMSVRPDQLPKLTAQRADDIQHATYQYLSRRMFRQGTRQVPPEETKAQAKQMVTSIRDELRHESRTITTTAAAEKNYRRFPELRPDEPADHDTSTDHEVFHR